MFNKLFIAIDVIFYIIVIPISNTTDVTADHKEIND